MNTSGHLIISLLVCLATLHRTYGAIAFTPNNPVRPTVAENAADGITVFTQAATTTGAGGSTVTFTLVGTSNDFAVATNGAVTVKTGNTLDYETTTEYVIEIQGVDDATSANTATVTVTIDVTDVNDNSPVYAAAGTLNYCSTSTSGTVGTYTATDADSTAAFNTLTYSINSGDDSGAGVDAAKFSMDTATAVITKTSVAFQSTKTVYELVLHAVDGGSPALTASTTLTVSTVASACSSASVLTGSLVAMATVLLSAILNRLL